MTNDAKDTVGPGKERSSSKKTRKREKSFVLFTLDFHFYFPSFPMWFVNRNERLLEAFFLICSEKKKIYSKSYNNKQYTMYLLESSVSYPFYLSQKEKYLIHSIALSLFWIRSMKELEDMKEDVGKGTKYSVTEWYHQGLILPSLFSREYNKTLEQERKEIEKLDSTKVGQTTRDELFW